MATNYDVIFEFKSHILTKDMNYCATAQLTDAHCIVFKCAYLLNKRLTRLYELKFNFIERVVRFDGIKASKSPLKTIDSND